MKNTKFLFFFFSIFISLISYSQNDKLKVLEVSYNSKQEIIDLKISPDCKTIAYIGRDHLFEILEIKKKSLVLVSTIEIPDVTGLDFTPDGKNILVCTDKNEYMLIDVKTRQIKSRWSQESYYGATEIVISPTGNFYLSLHQGWFNGDLQVFELNTHKLLYTYNKNIGVSSAVFTSDGQRIIGATPGNAFVIDAKTGELLLTSEYIHSKLDPYVKYNHRTNEIYSCNNQDNNILFINSATGKTRSFYLQDSHTPYISPDEKYLSFVWDKYICILNIDLNSSTKVMQIPQYTYVSACLISPNFKYGLAVHGYSICLFDLKEFSIDSRLFNKYFKDFYNEYNSYLLKITGRGEFETIPEFFDRDKIDNENLLNIKAKYLQLIENEKSGFLNKINESSNKIDSIINLSIHDTTLIIQDFGKYDIDTQLLPVTINGETKVIKISPEEAKALKENKNSTIVKAKKKLKYDLKDWKLYQLIIVHPISNNEYIFK